MCKWLKTRIDKLFSALYFIILLVSVPSVHALEARDSVVQIFATKSKVDYLYPWQMGSNTSSKGSGVIIESNRILTAAHVVDNALTLEVRRVGSDERFDAEVTFISDERDLAIISITNDRHEDFFADSQQVALGDMPALGEDVTVWGFPSGGDQLAITKGIVSRIDFDFYVHSNHPNLVVQVDAAINGGASGGPAINDGKLAGINFQGIDELDNVGYIIPTPVVQQFLDDVADGEVNGVPDIAFTYNSMRNQQKREYYGMSENQSGVLISHLSGMEKSLGQFKEGDVVLEVDGQTVGNDGTVNLEGSDRISMDWLLTRRQIGDTVPVILLREGKALKFNYTLNYSRQQARTVTRPYSGFTPNYTVIGGLVFQQLSHDYMFEMFDDKQWPSWMWSAYGEYKRLPLDQKEQIVIVSNVLPHAINRGYDQYEDEQIASVNGKPVSSIDDLNAALADDSSTLFITLEEKGRGPIVFNKRMLAEQGSELKERYGY